MSRPAPGDTVREPIRELATAGHTIPVATNPGWVARFPWLVQGTTGRGTGGRPFDLGLAGTQPVGDALSRWWGLRSALRMDAVVLARQVHGRDVLVHAGRTPGIHLVPPADGHHTGGAGLLLAVTVADCVPVSIAADSPPAVTLLHAGWRGIAAGMLEAGITAATAEGVPVHRLAVHFGPAICGECYEVGPEVHAALGLPVPTTARPVDLRGELARRAAAAGVREAAISRSDWCTRCNQGVFFGHRGGDAGRQVGILGIRADEV